MSKRKDESREGEKVIGKGIPGADMPNPADLAAASRSEPFTRAGEAGAEEQPSQAEQKLLPDPVELAGITTGPVDLGEEFDVEEAADPIIPPELFGLHAREAARIILDALMAAPALRTSQDPRTNRKLQARYLAQMAGALEGAVARL